MQDFLTSLNPDFACSSLKRGQNAIKSNFEGVIHLSNRVRLLILIQRWDWILKHFLDQNRNSNV